MKKITKIENKKFRTETELIVLCLGGKALSNGINGLYEIKGEKDTLSIHLDDNVGSYCYSVFCRFGELNELTGIYNSKHNCHISSMETTEDAIKLFDSFIRKAIKFI